jgi:DNA-binding LacI/PurR family transcriptional regulator
MKDGATTRSNGAITLSDIAERCGVSKITVSFALRGNTRKVGEATRKRIVETAREMGYDPSRNQAARKMALRKSGTQPKNHTVCVAVPEEFAGATYYSHILGGMMDVMKEHGYGLHLARLGNDFEAPLPSVITKGDADGLLSLYGSGWFSWWTKKLREEPNFGDQPIVTVIQPVDGCSCVRADDQEAGYTAAAHLLDLGHRFILHDFQTDLCPTLYRDDIPAKKDDSVPSRRLLGMQLAYRDRGLDANEFLTPVLMPHLDREVEERGPGLLQLMKDSPKYTAIIAQNDFSALRVWRVFLEAGIRIPDDVSLISFDDTDPMPSGTTWNILTTVRMPLREFGQESAGLILRAIDGKVKNIQNIVLPTELIIRHSTAPPRTR